jgi:MFS family permease
MHLQTDESVDKAAYDYMVVIQGLSTSLSQAGGFFGSFFISWTADRYGRLRSFQIACLVVIIGSALTAGAVDIPMFLFFRFFGGFGIGMLLVLFPMYAAELSPPRSRGFLVGQHGAGLCVGYNLAAAVSFGCYFAKNGNFAWRFPLGLQCLFSAVLFSLSFWMPESPRWLILKDRLEEAKTVVTRVHSVPGENDDFARAEFDLMVSQIQLERVKSSGAILSFVGRWKYLLSKKSNLHRAALGFSLMFGMQATGSTVINNYQIILYPGLGVGPSLTLGLYWVFVGVAFCANTTSALIVDRLGRRRSFLIGLIGCISALIGETIASSFLPSTSKAVLVLGVFFIFWYIPWYGSMVDGVMYTYTSEIWPSEIRSEGIALSMTGSYTPLIASFDVESKLSSVEDLLTLENRLLACNHRHSSGSTNWLCKLWLEVLPPIRPQRSCYVDIHRLLFARDGEYSDGRDRSAVR